MDKSQVDKAVTKVRKNMNLDDRAEQDAHAGKSLEDSLYDLEQDFYQWWLKEGGGIGGLTKTVLWNPLKAMFKKLFEAAYSEAKQFIKASPMNKYSRRSLVASRIVADYPEQDFDYAQPPESPPETSVPEPQEVDESTLEAKPGHKVTIKTEKIIEPVG